MTTIFSYTGGYQTFVVPTPDLLIDIQGASGGDQHHNAIEWATGGFGAWLRTIITGLTVGETLRVYVGGEGVRGTGTAAGTGGWNGGADGKYIHDGVPTGRSAPGGGGGSTDIRRSPYGLADRICVAGGAGGGGGNNGDFDFGGGGDGGTTGGEAGGTGFGTGGPGGGGGTGAAGGAGGGAGAVAGAAGTLGIGGIGGATGIRGGGGGGGGLYGGGGGAGTTAPGTGGGGGGGGSSYTSGTVELIAALSVGGDGWASISPIVIGWRYGLHMGDHSGFSIS